MKTFLHFFRTSLLFLSLLCCGATTAWAQTPPPTYAGATPVAGKVYRIKARFEVGGTTTLRPIVSDSTNAHLKNAADAMDDDVDGLWIWTAATGGHTLLSGSGDGKAFKFHNEAPATVAATSPTIFSQSAAGNLSPATTTSLYMGGGVSRWIVAYKTADKFGQLQNKSNAQGTFSNDFLLEEVDVKRYTIAAYGLSTAQANTVKVSYENYSSYLNATGLPVDGFFLFPTGTTLDVSKFTTKPVAGQEATVIINEADQRIELYYRNRWLDVLTSTAKLSNLYTADRRRALADAINAQAWGTSSAEAQAAMTALDALVNNFYATATQNRFVFLQSAATTAPRAGYTLRQDDTKTPNLFGQPLDAYRHKSEVFTFDFVRQDDQFRPIYRLTNLSTKAAVAKTPASNTNLGMTTVDADKGEFYLSARPEDNRVVFMCVNGVPNTLLHQRNEGQVMSWTANTGTANDIGSQFNIVPIEDKLLDYYRAQMERRKHVPLFFDAATVNAGLTALNPLTFATEAEVNASVVTADQKLAAIDLTADGRLFYLENIGRTGKFLTQNDTRTAMRGGTDARNLKQVFSLKYIGNERFRVLQFGMDADKAVANLPNDNQAVPLVDLTDGTVGSFTLDLSKSTATEQNLVGFVSDISGNMAHRYLHLSSGDLVVPWDGKGNASFWKLHQLQDHVKQPAIDRLTPLPSTLSALYPATVVDPAKQIIQALPAVTTPDVLRANYRVVEAQLKAVFDHADGQTVYFRHTGTKYLSADYNSNTSSITLLPSSSTTPTKQEAFLLRYLGDGQYALVHTMTGMVVNRTANGGNATALLATAIAHGGKYRLVAGAQDNRIGLEAQNPESLSTSWLSINNNNQIVPAAKSAANGYWDIELPNDGLIDEIWNEKKTTAIPELGDKVGTYRDSQMPARTEAAVEAEFANRWGLATSRTEKGRVLAELLSFAHTDLLLNLPKAGEFYRFISSDATPKLLTAPANVMGVLSVDAATTEADQHQLTNIYYLTADHSLLSTRHGLYTKGAALVATTSSHDQFTFSAANSWGLSLYYVQLQTGGYLSSGANAGIQLNNNSTSVTWKIERVEKFPVSFKSIPDAQTLLDDATLSVATVCCPKALELVTGVKAYRGVISADNKSVEMTEIVDIIPANTPVILVGTAGQTYLLPIRYDDTTVAPAGNVLLGQQAALDTPAGVFTLQSPDKTKHTGFYPYSGTFLSGFRAYLPKAVVTAPTQGLTLRFPNLTEISLPTTDDAVSATTSAAPAYDLSGRRIARPVANGLFIVNGRKMVR